MKTIITIFIVALTALSVQAQTSARGSVSSAPSAESLDKQIRDKAAARTMADAVVGSLIAKNSDGKVVLATGNEFETILGFTTHVPYVTPNKPLSPSAKLDEFTGIAYGTINAGDYVCPCGEKPGSVKKCEAGQAPYAKALTAGSNGSTFNVKVLAQNLRKK